MDEDSEGEFKIIKIVILFDILVQEFFLDIFDEDFELEFVVLVVLGSFQSGKFFFMIIFLDDREDVLEEEFVEGEV